MAEAPQGAKGRFSRRTFLKTAGVGAAATGLVGLEARPARPLVIGPDAAPLELMVNGELRKLSVEPRMTLLRALRNQLDLTGSKEVCDRGGCGACTVLLDGEPVNACLMLAHDAEGHEITTVEGLGTPDALTPLQAAFVECDALQCGFCTPGFVVAGTALLRRNPDPSLAQIQDGLAGNLCRCGTYGRVFEAVQKAARTQAPKRTRRG
jgi:aerobic-type carbon monoxide dehydrogenase small subunit (CoxS/CutS family)